MEMPRPTAAHERLNPLVGKWKGEEKMYPSPWDPQGGMAEAKIDNQLMLDGFAIAQAYAQIRGGQVAFTGHGVLCYDSAAKEYQMHWWDSMGTPVNVFRGQFEGQRLVLQHKSPMGHSRCTFDLEKVGSGRYVFKMEMSQDAKQWAPFMDGHYSRA